MEKKLIRIAADDGFLLVAALYENKEAKALVQIIHGAVEHKDRYDGFASFLQRNGYTVLVSDNRGHGESVDERYPLGYMDSVERLVEDQVQIMQWLKKQYPERKLYMFGHSLGSIFARCVLWEHDAEVDKLVFSGTVPYHTGAALGALIGRAIVRFHGKLGCNHVLQSLSGLSADNTWIVLNEESMESYRKDPLCGYEYPNISTLTVIEADKILHKWKAYKVRNPRLPILSVTGSVDKISGGVRGLKRTKKDLLKIGYSEMQIKIYENMGHEVLNEKENDKVYHDILRFFNG